MRGRCLQLWSTGVLLIYQSLSRVCYRCYRFTPSQDCMEAGDSTMISAGRSMRFTPEMVP